MAFKNLDTRAAAAQAIAQVFRQQGSLSGALPPLSAKVSPQDKALLQQLCFGVMRYFHRLNSGVAPLVSKQLKQKDQDIYALLLLGAYQLEYSRVPAHAAVASCVEACRALKKDWACKFVNGVLRSYQRAMPIAVNAEQGWLEHSHPKWLYKALQQAWPQQVEAILSNNNEHPPFTLRVNQQHHSRAEYLELLQQDGLEANANAYSSVGITLAKPCSVDKLPGFELGWVSVQDEAAQLAAELIQLQPGQHVLDACCAPGGKTCHLLEAQNQLAVTAVDSEARRLPRVEQNLERLGLNAKIICADASATDDWWDGELFDRILLDAPCSATGVIRRHPDIKLLRKPADIVKLAALQDQLLRALWPTLKPGGILLYATCSVLPAENAEQISQFIENTEDAEDLPIAADWGTAANYGRQLFPTAGGNDGFYYSLLRKLGGPHSP